MKQYSYAVGRGSYQDQGPLLRIVFHNCVHGGIEDWTKATCETEKVPCGKSVETVRLLNRVYNQEPLT